MGEQPTIARSAIPIGTELKGMAPIGIRWEAIMGKNGPKPAGNCPRGEFELTEALINNVWHEVVNG